ncbi:MAG: hypothetical protein SOH99_00880 [Acidipropionibacterium acidipropionici]|uniref:hypothetical protein n=1 Tax=Acidipropionibacterium acidipropionici TaxID=1748 RepID=UPI002F35E029
MWTRSGASGPERLGALVCVPRTPLCESCPVADHCRWLASWPKRHQAEKCLGTLLDDCLIHQKGSLLRL